MAPPKVAPSPKYGGSKASICWRSASAASICASGVPQRAVITSSVADRRFKRTSRHIAAAILPSCHETGSWHVAKA
jgi:hypothetical protein